MMLKMTRFVSLICAALACGLTMTHNLEMPGKQLLSGANWLIVQHTFYGGFAIVGGVAEVLGLISTGLLTSLLWKRRTGFTLTLIAAISFAGMLALFVFGNNPLNQQIAITAYVESITKEGIDAGGHPIGKIGPVPEGLVAWTVGIGACVVFTLWIGARR